jgi:acyl dehydratase
MKRLGYLTTRTKLDTSRFVRPVPPGGQLELL